MCRPQNLQQLFGGSNGFGQITAAGGQGGLSSGLMSLPTTIIGTALSTLQSLPLIGFLFSGWYFFFFQY